MKRHVITVLGFLITGFALWWAFRGIHYREVVDILGDVRYIWAAPIFGATLLSIWIRAYRWKVMLEPMVDVPLSKAYSSTMIGFMANNILPMRLGEVVRAYALGRSVGVSKSAAFATIVVERAFDLVALLLFLGVLLLRYSFDARFKTLGYIALMGCVVMFLVMALAQWKRDLVRRLFSFCIRVFPGGIRHKLDDLFEKFLDGFEVLSRGHHVLKVMWLSILVWLSMAMSFFFANLTFGLDLPIISSLVMTVVCALGVMVPSGPGFVGTFEVAAKYGLMLFKTPDRIPLVSEEVAISYAIFYHAIQFVPLTLLGFYHLWREKFSLTSAVEGDGDSE